jgi:hypothetical protein
MKRFSGFATFALLALLVAVPAYAQQPATATDPHHPGTPATDAAPAPPSAPGPKSPSMPMMDMCRQMMAGDMMAMSMMSGPLPADPKSKAEMLQMRGEMMKAMGDVMMKHAGRMQGPTPK